jgi:diguanylate cyclase (GGDEF)-like protein
MYNMMWFGIEFILVSIVILSAISLRHKLGMTPLIVAIASLQPLATIAATTLYWPLGEGLFVSPGSVILFGSMLATLLVVYVRWGLRDTRLLLYAILGGGLLSSVMGAVFAEHMRMVPPVNFYHLKPEVLSNGFKAAIFGLLLLYIDQLLVVVSYAKIQRRWPNLPQPIRFAIILTVVMIFDTIIFLGIVLHDDSMLMDILISGITGKGLAGLIYGLTWGFFAPSRRISDDSRMILQTLLFRSSRDDLVAAAMKDSMTGLYNRRYYDMVMEYLSKENLHKKISLLLIDLDLFKSVNDTLGHEAGDNLLIEIAQMIKSGLRSSDLPFRYGGDEFALIIPGSDTKEVESLATRIGMYSFQHPTLTHPVTLTVSTASFPRDTMDISELFSIADKRLYIEKNRRRKD